MGQKKEKYYSIFCKKNKDGSLALLSKDEEELKDKLLEKWLKGWEEVYYIVDDKIKRKELTDEEFWPCFESMIDLPKKYQGCIDEFKELTGIEIIHCNFPESVLFSKLKKILWCLCYLC